MLLEALLRLGSGPTSQPEAHPIFIWLNDMVETVSPFSYLLALWSDLKPFHLMGRRFGSKRWKKKRIKPPWVAWKLGDSTLIKQHSLQIEVWGWFYTRENISNIWINDHLVEAEVVLSSYKYTTGKCHFIQCGTLRKNGDNAPISIKQPYRNFGL